MGLKRWMGLLPVVCIFALLLRMPAEAAEGAASAGPELDRLAGQAWEQACGFAELYPQFREKDAVVLGVSKDSVASHKKFEEKFGLPFTILSDPNQEVIQAYDVLKEKSMYGRKYMGVVRSTYLIDGKGIIAKAFDKVKPADNAKQMLNEI